MLWRELLQRGYAVGYPILTDWLRPQREAARVRWCGGSRRRLGEQAQVDWGHVGDVEIDGQVLKLWVFSFTLAYSRIMMAEMAPVQKLGTLFRPHKEVFRQQLGGVPREVLYDPMKTVWQGTDKRGEIVWSPVFLDFARYWGFTPRLYRPYRARTKGKVESG